MLEERIMRLAHQIEQFVYQQRNTTVRSVAEYFHISERECLAELDGIAPYGVLISSEGFVSVDE